MAKLSTTILELAERLMTKPAAPYFEAGPRGEVERICTEHGLVYRIDRFGNLLVRLNAAPRQRPLALAAHLDHPGFEVIRRLGKGRWLVRFNGGVGDAYFRRGVRVRLMPGAIQAVLAGRRKRSGRFFEVRAATPISEKSLYAKPEFAVWELENFRFRRGQIFGRACDDLVGVASVLATIIELKRRRARVNVIGIISRAEEIGFQGALTVATGRALPRNTFVLSLETSRELPGVKMGNGVILRVGDRTSVFDPTATRFLGEVAARLAARGKRLQFQRALMSGGTCEATAYQEFGFQTAAVCVALGNYHNCAPRNRIREEFVSVQDASSMVELLVSVALQMKEFERLTGKLPRQLNALLRTARRRLRVEP